MTDATALLLLPRIRVQNANAISGPLTWGFPSPTAFTGFVHALERQFADRLEQGFGGVGIVCHGFEPQVFRPPGKRTQVFRLTRNPVGKDGATQALVEEGRAHLEVTLVIAVRDYISARKGERLAEAVMEAAGSMRLAGGSILPQRPGRRFTAQWCPLSEDLASQREEFRKLRRKLLPGFALVQREDRLAQHLVELREAQPEATAIDALLDLTRLNFEPDQPNLDEPGERQWGIRRTAGWLVPVPVGYAALTPLQAPGTVRNARDDSTPFRFVESLYSLGEWVGPHRLSRVDQLLWHTHCDSERGLYRCTNHYPASESAAENVA